VALKKMSHNCFWQFLEDHGLPSKLQTPGAEVAEENEALLTRKVLI